ncbi:hypothetical protein VZ95_10565, partial [Elstera litoralis]
RPAACTRAATASTVGVLPWPPTVRLPMQITGTAGVEAHRRGKPLRRYRRDAIRQRGEQPGQ